MTVHAEMMADIMHIHQDILHPKVPKFMKDMIKEMNMHTLKKGHQILIKHN